MRFIIAAILILFIHLPVQAQEETVSQTVTAYLPVTVSVDKLFIDGEYVPWFIDKPFLKIKKIIPVNNESRVIQLSYLQYKIVSNSSNPLSITADFTSLLNHKYSFTPDTLSIIPSDVIIPSALTRTPRFRPFVKLGSDVPPGLYEGTIIFTIVGL